MELQTLKLLYNWFFILVWKRLGKTYWLIIFMIYKDLSINYYKNIVFCETNLLCFFTIQHANKDYYFYYFFLGLTRYTNAALTWYAIWFKGSAILEWKWIFIQRLKILNSFFFEEIYLSVVHSLQFIYNLLLIANLCAKIWKSLTNNKFTKVLQPSWCFKEIHLYISTNERDVFLMFILKKLWK